MDRYTKSVLTLIAMALWALTLQNTGIVPAWAQTNGIVRVQICGVSDAGEVNCANIARDGQGWNGLYTFAQMLR